MPPATRKQRAASKQDLVPVQSRIDRELAEQFKEVAEFKGLSEAEIIRQLIRDYVDATDVDELAEHLRADIERRIKKFKKN